jgi:phenylalanyl-tRNA synthetase alpha chain
MPTLSEKIEQCTKAFNEALNKANSEQTVEEVRVHFLGRHGEIIALMAILKDLALEEKKIYGPPLNQLRQMAETAIREKKEAVIAAEIARVAAQATHFDVTAYKPSYVSGSLHPYTHIIERIEDIFISMGYSEAEGPEIEDPAHNFDALNIPQNHPARELHDTFWLELPERLLRTHTSTVQIRAMEKQKPPLAIFAPGRVYRHEATDATHDFMFMQCEGLLIDKHISLSNLVATLKTFMQALFGQHTLDIRVRPSYFPFVEPGLEVDISCPFCTEGCSICKKTRWIELGGAGLVHPNVLKFCSMDPDIYSGFAFGLGIERLAMLKYGINDIRLFRSGKIDFLRQF